MDEAPEARAPTPEAFLREFEDLLASIANDMRMAEAAAMDIHCEGVTFDVEALGRQVRAVHERYQCLDQTLSVIVRNQQGM